MIKIGLRTPESNARFTLADFLSREKPPLSRQKFHPRKDFGGMKEERPIPSVPCPLTFAPPRFLIP
ncbi:MAG: hypothetical protein OZSIB_0754 [Candidatus Ozemobacter sibiricus]|uniref:Uncharacterized protein n=1 Tax=Candidatus Ozemobacter sibiricus TaxID=2268124 RepID=A0A367ZUA5_9BACT|nr:MAG: hypothetical protein OZSIB_0754 [Candidatus Ozemobacter sibiricus]